MRFIPNMKLIAGFIILLSLFSCSENANRRITIIETTDLHGVYLPFDYIENEKLNASLSHSASYIKELQNQDEPFILLDNGDNLQGQPTVYYYNFIDTVSPHLAAEAKNYLGFDAGTVGNHDIETGHDVYDRLRKEYNFPLLAANAVDSKTGEPYFKPFTIIEKNGIRVAVLGLITPAVPNWLPPELYEGIEFLDMVKTAEKWMPVILEEKPDIVVGLFHSGWDKEDYKLEEGNNLNENGSAAVAYNVPGLDIIFNGHDHRIANEKFVNSAGDTILILNGGSRGQNLAQAEVELTSKKVNGKRQKILTGKILDVKDFTADPDFLTKFESQINTIHDYVDKVIGTSSATLSSRESYFGSSAFIDMIHSIQLEITGADISFAAPLSFDVKIPEGQVKVGDMFKLYRFENMLYTMTMTGEEIHKYLEYSYEGWINTMKKPGDLLLKFRIGKDGKPFLTNGKAWFANQSYNFDSAAGIDYTVDVSKPEGERITIKSFSDGRQFDMTMTYKVAVNSYRGNGGGNHFTEGSGISKDQLRSRLVSSTERDLRYYILKSIEEKKAINPKPLNNWKMIPEKWVSQAASREYLLLFGTTK